MKKPKQWNPNGYIFSAFRKIWRWSPARKFLLDRAFDGKKYLCASCKGRFDRESAFVDHKEPVIDPSKGFTNWQTYYDRLFCAPEGLQVLCLECHKAKTKKENALRRKSRGLK